MIFIGISRTLEKPNQLAIGLTIDEKNLLTKLGVIVVRLKRRENVQNY